MSEMEIDALIEGKALKAYWVLHCGAVAGVVGLEQGSLTRPMKNGEKIL